MGRNGARPCLDRLGRVVGKDVSMGFTFGAVSSMRVSDLGKRIWYPEHKVYEFCRRHHSAGYSHPRGLIIATRRLA